MPRIPTAIDLYKPFPEISRNTPNPPDMTAYGKGIEKIGEALIGLSDRVSKEDEGLDLIRAEAEHRKGLNELTRNFMQDTDHATYDQRYSEQVAALTERTAGMIRNPKQRERWQAKSLLDNESTRNNILTHGNALKRQEQTVQLEDALTTHLNTAISPDSTEKDRVAAKQSVRDSLVVAQKAGIVNPLHAKKLLESYNSQADEFDVKRRIANGEKIEDIVRDIMGTTGTGPRKHPVEVIGKMETPASDPFGGVANISEDSRDTKSYGNLGLNSGGSVQRFVAKYGKQFGLTAKPGTKEFDEQWKAAAGSMAGEMYIAETEWFDQEIAPRISTDLHKAGVPAEIADDERVKMYFADRMTQHGPASTINHKDRVAEAVRLAGDDPEAFLRAMSAADKANVRRDFASYLSKYPKNIQGLINRSSKREESALGVGGQSARYPDLTPNKRSELSNKAKSAYREIAIQKLESAEAELFKTGKMPVDVDGRTPLELAAPVLNANQMADWKGKLLRAGSTHAAVSPLNDMSDADGNDWVDRINPLHHDKNDQYPLPGVNVDEHYDIANKAFTAAEKRWNEISELRMRDPAKSVETSMELTAVRDFLRQSKGKIPQVNINEMAVEARLAAMERLGIPESQRHIVTKHEAGLLLQLPMYATPTQIEDGWKKAEETAKRVYGKYWERALHNAADLTIKGQEARETAHDLIPSQQTVVKKDHQGFLESVFGWGSKKPEKGEEALAPKPIPSEAQINWVAKDPMNRAKVFDEKFSAGEYSRIMAERAIKNAKGDKK